MAHVVFQASTRSSGGAILPDSGHALLWVFALLQLSMAPWSHTRQFHFDPFKNSDAILVLIFRREINCPDLTGL